MKLLLLILAVMMATHQPFINKTQTTVLPQAAVVAQLDRAFASRYLDLWLLAQDSRHGEAQTYASLDYAMIMRAVLTSAKYDPANPNPVIMLTTIFGQATNNKQFQQLQATMLEVLSINPEQNALYAAQLAVLLHHQHQQPALAQSLAARLRTIRADIPDWMRDLEMLFAEDQYQYAKALQLAQIRLKQSIPKQERWFLNTKAAFYQQQLDR